MSKFVGKRQKSEANLTFSGQIKQLNFYYPTVYDNPLSRLKKGCPIWIEIEQDDCIVFEMESDSLEKELKDALQIARKLGYVEINDEEFINNSSLKI